ncbi:gamma-aminobutyrate transaminase POP2 [Cucumis melo var. makuwa]|uniref:Gamma-aminobutyrate transaminase POP2 n=1 Tax=Cucumis melo var. makuwa TaxID=1194695 RepID=A0A5A7V791_CUCMM|nr:gamma-aminobutyrate transaminase POP2 [Cucumis melo var. makuwa]
MRPSFDIRCYNGCIVGGLRFHTSERDSRCTTQNSEVMVIDEINTSGNGDNNFFGSMLSFLSGFDETMFLEFAEELDNPAEGLSLVGDNSGTSQPSATLTSRRRKEYIEVVKGNLQRFFVLDFKDQEMNRFVEHQILSTFQEFQDDCHKHLKKYNDPEEAHANLPHLLVRRDKD